MQDEHFRKLVDEAIDSIPQEFHKLIENVAIVVADFPDHYQMSKVYKKGQRGMLLGLYEGVPKTKRGRYGVGMTLPDKITIFKIPLLKISRNIEDLKQKVRSTVIHEIAHHFGMDEKQVQHAEKARILNRKN